MLAVLLLFLLVGFAITFGIGVTFAGAVLTVMFWMLVKLPMGFGILLFGAALCCTIILIPLGIPLICLGARLMVPGGAI